MLAFTLLGQTLTACDLLSPYEIDVCGTILLTNLILLNMTNFDVIFGMDWSTLHHAYVNCHSKQVNFFLLNRNPIVF